MAKRKTTEELIKQFIEIHGEKYEYEKFVFKTQHDKINIYCKHHRFWFKQQIVHHLNGHGCPICNGGGNWTSEMFIIKAIEVHGNKYIYSNVKYKNKNSKVEIICPVHGSFLQKAHDHISGCGCPKCAKDLVPWSSKSNTTDFINKCIIKHGNKYNYDYVNYINNHTPVKIICPEHGEFWQKPINHLQGKGCPRCILKSQEKIYKFLKEEFPNEIWEWEFSPKWLGQQRFDIYCSRLNLAIEYNGRQHYTSVKRFGGEIGFQECIKRDLLKTQLCKDHNCTLYIIKYDNVNYNKIKEDINNILNNHNYEN